MALVDPSPTSPQLAQVWKTEEKGSDVSLATHMVHDAHRGACDVAVVVSNDSDLLEPIRILKKDLGKTVGVLNPHKKPARQLLELADFFKPIRSGVLGACQFPITLKDTNGKFTKPASW